MKHMLIMRANAAAVEAYGEMNMEEVINAMGAYNESMITAGVLVGGDGLAPEPGYLVDFSGETPVVSSCCWASKTRAKPTCFCAWSWASHPIRPRRSV